MTTKNQLKWRRNKVLDYLAKGLDQSEIAENLKVSNSTITNDICYLVSQAKEQMKSHIEDKIPIEFSKCMNGIDEILNSAWKIRQKSEDERTQLQALAIANDCYRHKMDLVTNGVIVTDAIKFIQQNKNNTQKQNNDASIHLEQENEIKTTTTTTTNSVF